MAGMRVTILPSIASVVDSLLLWCSEFEAITYLPHYQNAGKVVRIPLRSIAEWIPRAYLASGAETAWDKRGCTRLTDHPSVFKHTFRDPWDHKIKTKTKCPYLDSLVSAM